MNEFETDDDYVAKAYVENMPDELEAMWSELSMDITKINAQEEAELYRNVEEQEAELFEEFPENISGDVAEYDVASGKVGVCKKTDLGLTDRGSYAQDHSYTNWQMRLFLLTATL